MADQTKGPSAKATPEPRAFAAIPGGEVSRPIGLSPELEAERKAAILADMGVPAKGGKAKQTRTGVERPPQGESAPELQHEEEQQEEEKTGGDTGAPTSGEQEEEQQQEQEEQQQEEESAEQEDPAKKEAKPLDAGLDELFGDDPKHAGLKKRVRKILADDAGKNATIKDLKDRLTKVDQKPPVVVAPSERNPLSHLVTQEELAAFVDNERAWRDWCEVNMPPETPDPETGEVPKVQDPSSKEPKLMSRADVQKRLQQARRCIEAEDSRSKWIEDYNATQAHLRTLVPDLYDEDSPRRREALAIFTDIERNGLSGNAKYERRLAALIEGERVLKLREKGITLVELKKPQPKGNAAGEGENGKGAKTAAPAVGAASSHTPPPVRQGGGAAPPDTTDLEARAARGDEDARRALLKIESGIGQRRVRAA